MKKNLFSIFCFLLFLSFTFTAAGQTWHEMKKLGPGWNNHKIDFDSQGNVCIIWPGNGISFVKSLDGGANWTETEYLSPIPGDSSNPDMALDSKDHIYVVFENDFPGKCQLYFTRSTNGGSDWTTPIRIAVTQEHSMWPQIVTDSNDRVYIFWHERVCGHDHNCPDGHQMQLYHIQSADGGMSWSSPGLIVNGGPGWTLDAAVDSRDNIFVFYSAQVQGGSGGAKCFKSTDGGNSWTYSSISSGGGSLAAAIDSKDNIHIFKKLGGVNNTYFGHIKSEDGGETWSEPYAVIKSPGSSNMNPNWPCIAVDVEDNIHAACQSNLPGNFEVYYSRSLDSGGTWTITQKVTNTPAYSLQPSIAIGRDNIVHFAWNEVDINGGSDFGFFYKRGIFSVPGKPKNLLVAAESSTQLSLTWQIGSGDKDGFRIERSLYPDREFAEIAFVLQPVGSYKDTGLSPGTTYYYRLKACYGPLCSGYTNTASAKTLPKKGKGRR